MRAAVSTALRRFVRRYAVPVAARREAARDRAGVPADDPGIDTAVQSHLVWLCRAQDRSASADGGVARDFSLITGWATSYPETTGYIVPTFLELARARSDAALRQRAVRMLDWLVSIQFPDGPFQGGKIDADVKVPVTFNTGQVLIGLAAGVAHLDAYHEAAGKAADWLVRTQDSDGAWRGYPTPFASGGEKTYETHVAWGLLEAHRAMPNQGWLDAAIANNRWALGKQLPNGWFSDCCLSDSRNPLTHTIGYALRGIVEAYLETGDPDFLDAATRTCNAIVQVHARDGKLSGRLNRDWQPTRTWVCLTGCAQLAHSLLLLGRDRSNSDYLETARALNRYVRQTVHIDGDPDTLGGVKGSFPVDGHYGSFAYLNWAAKFAIDANTLERELPSA